MEATVAADKRRAAGEGAGEGEGAGAGAGGGIYNDDRLLREHPAWRKAEAVAAEAELKLRRSEAEAAALREEVGRWGVETFFNQ